MTSKYTKAVEKTNKLRRQRRTAAAKLDSATEAFQKKADALHAELTKAQTKINAKLAKLRQTQAQKLAPLRTKLEAAEKAATDAALAAHKLGRAEGVSATQLLADFRGATASYDKETDVNPTN